MSRRSFSESNRSGSQRCPGAERPQAVFSRQSFGAVSMDLSKGHSFLLPGADCFVPGAHIGRLCFNIFVGGLVLFSDVL